MVQVAQESHDGRRVCALDSPKTVLHWQRKMTETGDPGRKRIARMNTAPLSRVLREKSDAFKRCQASSLEIKMR